MNNRDLIIKIARRLDKFSLNEIIVISELEENEVNNILSDLLKAQIIIKNNNIYYFNNKKTAEIGNSVTITSIGTMKQIIIEKEEGYNYFLTLHKNTQLRIRKYVELLNLAKQAGGKNLKNIIKYFNETSNYKEISYQAFLRIRNKFYNYGFKGLLPHISKHITSSIPEELYTYFKKYYLTKEKLSASKALYKAQNLLQKEQKIEQPFAFNANLFIRKIKTEFTEEQIEYMRNTVNPPRNKIPVTEIQEPTDMLFKQAAKIYFNRLKTDKKLEKLMQEKTSYKNHLKEYFGNLKIKEITPKKIADYKQNKYDLGFQLSSVKTYIAVLKSIIIMVCPNTNNLLTKRDSKWKNVYALNMNILSEQKIKKLLDLCLSKYPEVYPLIYISLSTGANIPELLGLTWDRVNFKEQTIFLKYFLYGERLIMNKCSSSMRKLKINSKAKKLLKKKFNDIKPSQTDFVFRFDTKKTMQLYFEEEILTKLSKKLRISKLYPSDFPHNFVNICLKQNIPITYIQRTLGFYRLSNFVEIYKDLIKNLEKRNYDPIEKLDVI